MATFQMEIYQQIERNDQKEQQHYRHPTNLIQRVIRSLRGRLIDSCLVSSRSPVDALQTETSLQIKPAIYTFLLPACITIAKLLSQARRRSTSRRRQRATSNYTESSTGSVPSRNWLRAPIMFSMLVVFIFMISGNGVLAAQRDGYKSKDLSGSNNAIPNDAEGNAAGADTNPVNGVSGSSSMTSTTNSNSNGSSKNGNSANGIGSMTTDISSSSSSSSANMKSIGNSSTSSTSGDGSGTSSTTAISGIASSSLHKVNTIASPASGSGINRNSIDLIDDSRNGGPYFDKTASKNVTALLGKTAYLNCRVKNLGNKTMLLQVSWVRHRDIHLLTVGRYTYTSDQRFRAIHQPQTEDWMLQIKYPQHRDSGIYECQVSTTPHMSHYIQLTVVEPSTEIIGAPDLYIESGSTINLTCVILNSPEPPAYIFWNHNNAIINYDSPRGGVSVVTNKGETTTSFLLIKSARPSDSGHYQCNPSNAKPKSVTVHVLNGEFPAAMQHAVPVHPPMSPSRSLLVYLFVCFCSLAFVNRSMRLSVGQRRRPAVEAVSGEPTLKRYCLSQSCEAS